MSRDEVDDLRSELSAWAKQAEHGAQTELARFLSVPKRRVNHWVADQPIEPTRWVEASGIPEKPARAKPSRGAFRSLALNAEINLIVYAGTRMKRVLN